MDLETRHKIKPDHKSMKKGSIIMILILNTKLIELLSWAEE